MRHTAAQVLGDARHDGTYELLLTTALQPSDVVWGTLEALRRQFRVLCRCVLALEVVMMFAGLASRPWDARALAVYFLAWAWLLGWAWSLASRWRSSLPVMWVSLNSGRPVFAVCRASGGFLCVLLWTLYNLRHNFLGFIPPFPTGEPLDMIIAALLSFGLLLALLVPPQTTLDEWESRLVSEFREIVREPVPDADDPRFRQWDCHQRFPWGWKVVQHQLHERLARRPFARRRPA
jgi:hypothetical protein